MAKPKKVINNPLAQLSWQSLKTPEGLKLPIFGLLVLFLFVTPWLRLPSIPHPLTSYFFSLVWLTTFLLLLTTIGLWKKWLTLPSSPYFWWVGIWFIAKAVSGVFSIVPQHSWWGAYGIWSDGVIYLVLVIVLGGIVLALKPSTRDMRFVMHGLLIQLFLLSLGMMLERFTGTVRPLSAFLNPDYYLSYATLLFPLAIILFVQSVRAWLSQKQRSLVVPVLYFAHVFIICIGMYVSLPVDLQLWALDSDYTTGTSFLENSANNERFYQWELGTKIAQKYPVTGSGPGSTQAAFYDLHNTETITGWDYDSYMAHPHNDIIEQWSQNGWVGLSAYILFLGATFMYIWRKRQNIEAAMRPYALGLALGLGLCFAFNQFLFLLPYTGVLIGLWIVFLLLLTNQITYAAPRTAKLYQVGVTIIVLLMLVLSFGAGRYARAEQLVNQAQRVARSGDFGQSSILYVKAATLYSASELYAWRTANEMLRFMTSGQTTITPTLVEITKKFADRAVTLNPYVPLYNLQEGVTFYVLSAPKSSEEALGLALIERSLTLTPNDYDLYLRAARAFRQKNDTARMEAAFTKAREKAPSKKRAGVEATIREITGT